MSSNPGVKSEPEDDVLDPLSLKPNYKAIYKMVDTLQKAKKDKSYSLANATRMRDEKGEVILVMDKEMMKKRGIVIKKK